MAIKYYTSFSLVFLATATFLFAGQAKARLIVGDLCSKTDFPALCTKIEHGLAQDARLATEIAIKALIDETTEAMATVSRTAGDAKVKNCFSSYSDALDNLKKSLDNIRDNDPGSLMSNLSAVVADYGTCDDAFADANQPSPFANINKRYNRMASNCLALASEIKF